MGKAMDYLFNNASAVDQAKEEEEIRKKYPLLLLENEALDLAFSVGRDKSYFTSQRILIVDGKGVGQKRKNFLSIPYNSILAFSIQTSGPLEGDAELVVYSTGVTRAQIDFSAKAADIFQVTQYLNTKLPWSEDRGTSDVIDPIPPNMDKKQSTFGSMVDWLGDNAHQIDAKQAEEQFKSNYPVLLQDETVELAFQSGRDTKCLTSRRVLLVNVKGLMGKKVEFLTLPYYAIHGYYVQTAGSGLDRDAELRIYTNIMDSAVYQIDQDFRSGKANLWAIQKCLSNHILGDDKAPMPGVDNYQGHQDGGGGGLLGLILGTKFNERPIDAVEMDRVLHTDPPILQGSEQVEMAFQGHRDITVFTTKRLLTIDKKGLTGKRVEYCSIPWEKFVAFGVRKAGAFLDFDTELLLYTEMGFYPGEAAETDPPKPAIPARPEQSCFELDFNKDKVDLFLLKYYLSHRIMDIHESERGAPLDLSALTGHTPDPQGFERLFQWLGSDQRELDPTELDTEFHTNTKILLDNEKVLMAFKGGRDVTLFTNMRFLSLDVQGLVGCKIEYTSVPFRNIHAYSIQSAGLWDRDSELTLYTRNRWDLAQIDMDFRQGKSDIMQIQKLLSGFIIGLPTDPKMTFAPKDFGSHEADRLKARDALAGFFDNSKEIPADELNVKFHQEIDFLLEEETILKAFKQSRDMFFYTNRRFILVDTKGLSGKRVMYKSIPYRHVDGVEFETAGHMDRDAEVYCHTTIAHVTRARPPRSVGTLKTKQSILVKHTDIYEIGRLLCEHTILDERPKEVEPDIAVVF